MSHAYTQLGEILEWNSEEACLRRRAMLEKLLPGPGREVTFLIPGFTAIWPDLDVKLVNRDLGWFPESALLAEVYCDIDECEAVNRFEQATQIKPNFYVTCRIVPPRMRWQERANSGLREGDFVISLSLEGKLEGCEFRRSAPLMELRENDKPKSLRVRSVPGRDTIELFTPPREAAVAGIVGAILEQLRRLDPLPPQQRSR